MSAYPCALAALTGVDPGEGSRGPSPLPIEMAPSGANEGAQRWRPRAPKAPV